MANDRDRDNQRPLSARLALAGALVLGLSGSLIIGPALFPKDPGQGFSVAQMLCAAVGGGLGAGIGFGIGRLIEGPKK
jgi:hypothetical protein